MAQFFIDRDVKVRVLDRQTVQVHVPDLGESRFCGELVRLGLIFPRIYPDLKCIFSTIPDFGLKKERKS